MVDQLDRLQRRSGEVHPRQRLDLLDLCGHHAADTDAAKILAFSYPGLREGMAREENAKTELTAIVETDLNRSDDEIAFALAVLAKAEIAIRTAAESPAVAQQARADLRL